DLLATITGAVGSSRSGGGDHYRRRQQRRGDHTGAKQRRVSFVGYAIGLHARRRPVPRTTTRKTADRLPFRAGPVGSVRKPSSTSTFALRPSVGSARA